VQPSFKLAIELSETITILDWAVFAAVAVATVLAVFYGHFRKRAQSSATKDEANIIDLLLMGRQLTLPMFVGTLVATWYGGIFGVTEIAFSKGIFNFVTQGLFWYVAYIVFALFIVKHVKRYEAVTLPDLVGTMFGPRSARLSGVFNFFNVLPISYVISLGLFLQAILGWEFFQSMFVGVTLVVLYSMWGGLRAVVFSDLVQFFVMCSGVAIILLLSVSTFGGLSFLRESLPENHFSLTGGEGLSTTLVWGFIALSTLVDPNFYQRVFAAQSTRVARNGILISTFIWFCFDICTTFGAMYARAVIPEAESGSAYLVYALQLLPDGVRGFVLAGILATILSTLDSYLFLAGTTLSYDLAPAKHKGKTALHAFGIVFVAALAVALALVFDGNIKTVWKTLGSYSASCLLLPVLYGYIFPGRIKDSQFVFGCLMGVVGTTYWRNFRPDGFLSDVDELYFGVLCTTAGLLSYSFFAKRAPVSETAG
jgi:SSS family solute:Na+ symporter